MTSAAGRQGGGNSLPDRGKGTAEAPEAWHLEGMAEEEEVWGQERQARSLRSLSSCMGSAGQWGEGGYVILLEDRIPGFYCAMDRGPQMQWRRKGPAPHLPHCIKMFFLPGRGASCS